MYKIDDEFRPRGRVFMKATHENQSTSSNNTVSVPVKSSLKKGPPITTSLDDRRIQFQHEVKHEKTIEALITEYPPGEDYHRTASSSSYTASDSNRLASHKRPSIYDTASRSPTRDVSREITHYTSSNRNGLDSNYDVTDNLSSMQAVTRNKRLSTEVLGSSFESKKLSQRAPDGHRRITTHIVRKVTTLSRAEENAQAQNLIKSAHNKTTEIGYMTTQAIEPKRTKVF